MRLFCYLVAHPSKWIGTPPTTGLPRPSSFIWLDMLHQISPAKIHQLHIYENSMDYPQCYIKYPQSSPVFLELLSFSPPFPQRRSARGSAAGGPNPIPPKNCRAVLNPSTATEVLQWSFCECDHAFGWCMDYEYIIYVYVCIYIIFYYIILYYIILYFILLYYIILYCIILYCIILYYFILFKFYYIILYYIIFYSILLYYYIIYYII